MVATFKLNERSLLGSLQFLDQNGSYPSCPFICIPCISASLITTVYFDGLRIVDKPDNPRSAGGTPIEERRTGKQPATGAGDGSAGRGAGDEGESKLLGSSEENADQSAGNPL